MKISSDFKKYFFNSNWMFLEHGLKIFSGVFVSAYVARYLGITAFGLFSYVIAYAMIGEGVSRFGAESIVVRDLVKDPDSRSFILSSAFYVRAFTGITVFLILNVSAMFAASDVESFGLISLSFIFLFQPFEVVEYQYNSIVQAKTPSLIKAFSTILFSLVKLFAVHFKYDVQIFFIIFALEKIFTYLCFALFMRLEWIKTFKFSYLKKFVGDCTPLVLSSLAVILYMRLDQIMIKNMLGSAELGVYSVTVKLTEVWSFIPIVLSTSLFPKIINSGSKIRELKIIGVTVLPSFIIFIFLLLFGTVLVNLLYGPDFLQAGSLLKIQSISLLFMSLGISISKVLIKNNLQKYKFAAVVVGLIINLILNLILIPKFGIFGASVATVVCQIFSSVLYLFIFVETRRSVFSYWRSLQLGDSYA